MTRGRALLLLAGLALFCLVLLQPRTRADTPDWVVRRHEWAESRRSFHEARWNGTLEQIAAAFSRKAELESSYVASIEAWARSGAAAKAQRPGPTLLSLMRESALDLADRGKADAAVALLEGPLRGDRVSLPLRARLAGLRAGADSGLALLSWPPDRPRLLPGSEAAFRWDDRGRTGGGEELAAHVVAAELADSAGLPRVRRAALWTFLDDPRSAVRSYGRIRLARSLAARGEPRLAGALIQSSVAATKEEEFLLAGLRADLAMSEGDTLEAVRQLARGASDSDLPTSSRYTLALRATRWLRGARADSLAESQWLDLVRTLGLIGEAESGLSLLHRRRIPAPTPADALARAEAEAVLLARLKRNTEASVAYSRLLARADAPRDARARFALGLARAYRGKGDFARMDSAFVRAVTLDSTSSTAAQAAWERAREWEDKRTPREAAAVFAWGVRYTRDWDQLKNNMRHRVIAWLRAGEPDSANAAIADVYEDERGYWRAMVATAKGDSGGAVAGLQTVGLLDPWSYEAVRSREELTKRGIALQPRVGTIGPTPAPKSFDEPERGQKSSKKKTEAEREPWVPTTIRLLGSVGATELMMSGLRECARGDSLPSARACTDALEERGIFRIGRGDALPPDRLEYPPAYPTNVLAAASAESLSASLLWAIMRQESGYQRGARSRAGAIGLLQLLPSSASRLNGSPVPEASLTDPDLNVRLGARYLKNLLREFQDPRAAMAAYNAGEDVVRGWLQARPVIDDIWVELIPYRETRDYVKQVYTIWRRYESIYGVPSAGVAR